MSETCVIVGGKHDGRRIRIHGFSDAIQLPVFDPVDLDINNLDADAIPTLITYHNQIYRRFTLRGGGQFYYVFVLEGMPPEEVVGRLIDGYRRKVGEVDV